MRNAKLVLLLLALSGLTLVVGCDDDTTDPVDDIPTKTVTDVLEGSTGKSIVKVQPASGNTIRLRGFYYVDPGARLEIPAGTTILCESGSALVVRRGNDSLASGQLIAQGTASAPIVFTSTQPAGSRGRANWGGVVLAGLANLNVAGGFAVGEGGTGEYGYGGVLSAPKNDDNSGILRYVRIEYGGTKITADNEINGLTMNAVGSGTEIAYVQTHMIADDGFEWFGGTVNAKYLVSSGNDDDAFDMDYGYSGKVQFLFGMQDPELANRGFEVDNDGSSSSNTPFTSATVANVTIVGAGVDKTPAGDNNDGFYLRRNNKLKIYNAIVTNFREAMVIDGRNTSDNVQAGELFVKNSLLNGSKGAYGRKDTSVADYATLAQSQWNNVVENPNLVSIDFANPNPKPTNAKAANVGQVPSGDGFFDQVRYAGAFDPGASALWINGWTNWAKK